MKNNHLDLIQIKKFYNHKKLFNINNKYLYLFEDLLKKSDNFLIQNSCKIKKKEIFPCRFNLYYKNKWDHKKNIKLIFHFLKNASMAGIKINYKLIKQMFTSFKSNIEEVKQIIIGIDFRNNFKDSRIKIWFVITKKNSEMFNLALGLHGYNKKICEIINGNELLFGFDFCFNNKTRIKIYPSFNEYELKNIIVHKKLKKIFHPKIIALISECKEFNISFTSKNFNRNFHFHPIDCKNFLSKIKNKELQNLINIIDYSMEYCILSLEKKEIENNQIENLNLYY